MDIDYNCIFNLFIQSVIVSVVKNKSGKLVIYWTLIITEQLLLYLNCFSMLLQSFSTRYTDSMGMV